MIDKDDWRLTNQINYLKSERLKYAKYKTINQNGDHDHCEFCWRKFTNDNDYGYCTLNNYHWICETCFNDFKEMFKWVLIE